MLRALETGFQPKWEEINENPIINEIVKFAEGIEKLGIEYRYSKLVEWGKQLKDQVNRSDIGVLSKTQVNRSDIGVLSKTLERFPELIRELKDKR